MDLANKKILITGGSSGIGKALIKACIEHGANQFAILARDEEKLNQLKREFPNAELTLISCDLSNPKAIKSSVDELAEEWKSLDILINNAGVVSAGSLESMSDEDIIQQVNINLTGLILLTKHCMALLSKSEEGGIINISSGLGYIAWPFYSVYAATKAGVRQFSDALSREYHNYPLHVMTAYPTATDTPMMDNAKVDNMDDVDYVAKRSIDGFINKERNVIFGGDQRLVDIESNFSTPEVIDEKSKERFEDLRKRTEHHRAM